MTNHNWKTVGTYILKDRACCVDVTIFDIDGGKHVVRCPRYRKRCVEEIKEQFYRSNEFVRFTEIVGQSETKLTVELAPI